MHRKNAELIPAQYIVRAKKLGTAELCDAINALQLNIPNSGCMAPEIKPVSDDMKVVGTAMTVETKDGDNLPIHLCCYNEGAEGYVLVIDGKGYNGRAYLGDLILAAVQTVGFSGTIIDGYTRDKLGNISLGFPVWSRGFIPNSPIKKDSGSINTDIICGGVKVQAGDLVVGDADGVCVVPREHIAAVLDKAEEKELYEDKRRELIREYTDCKKNGFPLPQLAPQWVLDMQTAET